MYKLIGLLLLLYLLFSGCRPLSSPITSKSTPLPLTLDPCIIANGTVKGECSELSVPEDRNNPNGRIRHVEIAVVRAREANPKPDPLFYIAGVPAMHSSVIDSVNNFFKDINARHNIVFVDPRGTNDKDRLTCDLTLDEIANSTQQINERIKKCLAILAGDQRFYTTAVAMSNLDNACAALGYIYPANPALHLHIAY